ncbi:dephospho-CoA kinase [Paradesulfitobacterium ferrireducens]|uniref:dephospho-CoA kinase n=1 Tax=Paradesulfitobacterium ferrireducens TaxID=2816476 RepID=UPI001A8CE8C0|nr:dephospho-CoA kinase [Paradesulfitobacterium ferrireducens]
MHTIGLTGGIGSGKSSVAGWFQTHGVPVLDADKIVHQLLAGNSETIARLAREFGQDILGTDGAVDRRALGRIVFNDEIRRRRLENILHPQVLAEMERERIVLKNQGEKVCIWDVPLLFEAGMDKFVDEVWVVWVPLETQIGRVLQRDKLSREEILARLQAQMPLEDKASRAETVIDNSKTWKETEERLKILWKRLVQDLNQKK